jgi:hypothetical protein
MGAAETARSAGAVSVPVACQAGSGFRLPFAITGSIGRYSMTVRVAR